MTGINAGKPGRNWDNPSNLRNSSWNGHVVTELQREYQSWRETVLAEENVIGAMTAKRVQASDELLLELDTAEAQVVAALRGQAAESEREIKRLLAPIVDADPDAVSSLALSMNRCAESPMLGCVFDEPPEFGDSCPFCHLAYR
jgi:hypothetical protein